MKRKLIIVVALLMSSLMAVTFFGCNDVEKDNKNQIATTYVCLEINPKIELILDGDNKVMTAVGVNEDGQVLLYKESGIVGESVTTAVENVYKLAKKYGFINDENKVTTASVSSKNNNGFVDKIKAVIKERANAFNMEVDFDNGSFSMNRKLQTLKNANDDDSKISQLSITDFYLSYSANKSGEVSINSAVEINKGELIDMVYRAHKSAEQFTSTFFNKAKTSAESVYESAVGALYDGAYTTYYMSAEGMKKHLSTCWYGTAYQVYKTLSRGLSSIAKSVKHAEDLSQYELTEAEQERVLALLNLTKEDKDKLKNYDGIVTIESVESFVDKTLKNSDRADIKEIERELFLAFNDIESSVVGRVEEFVSQYKTEIEKTLNTAEELVNMIPENTENEILATFKSDFNECVNQIKSAVSDGVITSNEVSDLSKMMEDNAQKILEKIEKDLSKEELENIEQKKEQLSNQLASLKNAFNQTVGKAEGLARTRLDKIKEQRAKVN